MNSGKKAPALEAFVVEPIHIDAILSVALHGPADFDPRRYPGWDRPLVDGLTSHGGPTLCSENATEVGTALLAGCVASVIYQRGERRAPTPRSVSEPYQFEDLGPALTVAESCKALACLECQSSEDPGWAGSAARDFCGALLWRLISTLPGYSEAAWELSADSLTGRVPATTA